MAGYDGSGNFNFTYSWANDAANGIPITASRMDTQFQDAANGFDLVICNDGQSTTSARIPFAAGLSTAQGLTFPAVAVPNVDPNTMDDYEEGTFSPIFNFNGSNVGFVYVANVGRYTKIGNRVAIQIYVRASTKGSNPGVLTIELLPFTSINVANAIAGGGAYWNGMTSAVVCPNWFISPNATNISIRNWASGTDSAVSDTQCANNLEIGLQAIYESNT